MGGSEDLGGSVGPRKRGLGRGLGAILSAHGTADTLAAQRDPVTDLPNRSLLDERLEQALARCREDDASLAVLVVSLDGFGTVNELFGHGVGDDLLHDMAARLSASRRKMDTVARFAGDEFVVVCPFIGSPELACRMATRILEDVSKPTVLEGVEHRLSASIGVVFTSPFGTSESVESLLGDASIAMRHVKEDGGASWRLFEPSMREHATVRYQNRLDLRAALEEGGLVLTYEPIVDLVSGSPVGEAAILDWSPPGAEDQGPEPGHPGAVAAAATAPRPTKATGASGTNGTNGENAGENARKGVHVATSSAATDDDETAGGDDDETAGGDDEHSDEAEVGAVEGSRDLLDLVDEAGLATPIVRWVLDEALSELSIRRITSTLPASFRVWVKVAPSMLGDVALVDALDELTAKHGVPLSMVGLDVREPLGAMVGAAEPVFTALAERDVAIALDDFGTGLSNLSRLTQLPVRALKLAPELVIDLVPGPAADDGGARAEAGDEAASSAALVRGLVDLGRALGLEVVAQGVEYEAQVVALRSLGCAFAQGPMFEPESEPTVELPDEMPTLLHLDTTPDGEVVPDLETVPAEPEPPGTEAPVVVALHPDPAVPGRASEHHFEVAPAAPSPEPTMVDAPRPSPAPPVAPPAEPRETLWATPVEPDEGGGGSIVGS